MKTVNPAPLALRVPAVLAVSPACPVCPVSRVTVVSPVWTVVKANPALLVIKEPKDCPVLWAPSDLL